MIKLLELFGLPINASKYGGGVDATLAVVHWMMLILLVGWSIFFVITLFRFRESRNPKADYQGIKVHVALWVMVLVAVVEIGIEHYYSNPYWAHRVEEFPSEDEATVVRVIGSQFQWNIHYPGPDGLFGQTSPDLVDNTNVIGLDRSDPNAEDDLLLTNQLHVPVDKPVIVHLRSLDVIHSFFLPEMRVKQDAVPGMDIPIWFEPKLTTEEMRKIKVEKGLLDEKDAPAHNYTIACAQLCGLGHYRMRGMLIVETQEEFDKWYEEELEYASLDEDEEYYEDDEEYYEDDEEEDYEEDDEGEDDEDREGVIEEEEESQEDAG